MRRSSPSPRGRVALFVVLVGVGLAYIVTFVWFKRNSVDFIDGDRDRVAVLAARAIYPPSFAWTFGRGSQALAMLGGGWRRPDPEAVWSERQGGVIYLPASIVAGTKLEVRFAARLNPSDSKMTVLLDADGETIGEWRITQQQWQVVAYVTLPSRGNEALPWRLQFLIERPSRPLWRGYPPGLLGYGIHLRGLRTMTPVPNQHFE